MRQDALGLAVAQHIHADARAIAQRQIERLRLLQHQRAGPGANRGDQRPLDFGAGGVTRMQHPAAAMRGLAGQIVAVGQVVWG